MRLVLLSDTHMSHGAVRVPDGDVLAHCGDALGHGTYTELLEFADWLAKQPHRHKVVIAGNHDRIYQIEPEASRKALAERGVTYLQDEAAEIGGARFYGSPWTPKFYDWAFMLPRGAALARKWAQIPDLTDVLLTHGPPYGHGDLAPGKRVVGCRDLLDRVHKVRPRVHAFGHIHEGRGVSMSDEIRTAFVNAAIAGCSPRLAEAMTVDL